MGFIKLATSAALDAVGLSVFARQIEETGAVQAVDQLSLQGLLALWRPSVGQ
jgi:protease-4